MFIKYLYRSFFFFLLLISATTVSAQTTYYVSQFSNLQSTINGAASGDIIEIQNDLTTTTPASGFSAITISKTLTINGNGYTITVPVTGVSDAGINNTGSGGTSTASTYRVLATSGSSVVITINDWKVKGGNIGSNGSGGCILNSADKLILNNVTISNGRSATGTLGNGGGGMSNSSTGRVYMTNCMITRNSAGYGGGFLNDGGRIYLEKTTFTENRSEYNGGGGGGCETKNSGLLYFNNCTFSNNYSTEYGGGINNYNSTIYVANSTFTGNVVYGATSRGAAISNRNVEYVVNCIFAYNYYRSAGTATNPTGYTLDDFGLPSGTGTTVNCYHSIYHSSSNLFNTSTSTGNIQYTGAADGSDNTIFAGGIYTKITDGTGTEIGTAKVYQPLLVTNTSTKTATLKLSSFPNQSSNKGVVTGYTDGSGSPSMGYKTSGGTWVNILGTSASSNVVTKDQLGTTRSTSAPTRGSVETEIATVYMLKSVTAANGYTTGASIYGDVYSSGTQVSVTATANTGYQFSQWIDYSTGSTLSSSNPYTITLTSNLTIQPVFTTSTSYTVTYLGNNNSTGTAPSIQTFSSGGSVTISNQGTLVRDEYYFDGWNTQPSGGGTSYTAGNSYSTAGNLTLYAKWTPYVKYYIKSTATSTLNNTSNWTGYPDGTGGNPSNFGSDKIFILNNTANSTSFTTSGDWSVAGALQIPEGKTLTITDNTTLTVSGEIFNSATILSAGSGSTLSLEGTSAQNLGGNNTLSKLIINNSNGVALSGSTNITNSLTLTNGAFTTNGYLTLKSNATRTAIVNTVVSSSVIGNVVVERYVPAKRAFRFISVPVTTSGTIYTNLQEGGSSTAGFGTQITGSTSGANGFDATQTGNSSMFTHDNSAGTWSAVTNTNVNTLTAGNPYRLMIRGDRTLSLATNTPTPTNTVLRANGTLYTGSKVVSNLSQSANGFSFVGNPYQAPVDMSTILSGATNLNSSFYYVWDPNVSTRGAYVTVDLSSNTNNVSGSGANKFLQPWQACFVKTINAGSASLTFTENSKGSTFSNTFKVLPPLSSLNIQLFVHDSLIKNAMPSDGAIIHFDPLLKNEFDQRDAIKPVNQDENFAISSNAKLLSIESRNIPLNDDTIQFTMNQLRDSSYTLTFDYNEDLGLTTYLYDRFLGLNFPIEQKGKTQYHFKVNGNPDSKSQNRFALVFKSQQTGAVNQVFKKITIYPNPIENGILNFGIPNLSNQKVELTIKNILGQQILAQPLQLNEFGNAVLKIEDHLSKGTYFIEVISFGKLYSNTILVK